MTKKELEKLIVEHELWLSTDGKEGKQLVLLRENFVNLNLKKCNFTKAIIKFCTFKNCNLERAKFLESNIYGCDFYYCVLSWVAFDSARIDNSEFHFSSMTVASLNNAIINNSIFSANSMDNIIAKDSTWTRCQIIKCSLVSSFFTNSIIDHCYFSFSILHDTDFKCATFIGSNFNQVDFECTSFYKLKVDGKNSFNFCKFYKAYFAIADLYRAEFRNSLFRSNDFSHAKLKLTDFISSELFDLNFLGADLNKTCFTESNLDNFSFADWDKFRLGEILSEPIIGYKKLHNDVIAELEIPAGAIVFCIDGEKRRTNKAKVISLTEINGEPLSEGAEVRSIADPNFLYKVGKELEIKDFDLRYNVECASGIHFFKTLEEAKKY